MPGPRLPAPHDLVGRIAAQERNASRRPGMKTPDELAPPDGGEAGTAEKGKNEEDHADWTRRRKGLATGSSLATSWRSTLRILKKQALFFGPGIIASTAYMDPGNFQTDLQAGSAYGYSHLFVVLFAGMVALLFQVLSTRLGCVTGMDLSQHCRLALHDRPRHKMFYRWGVLYPLYGLCEVGIVFTDLAELLGSAIAINLYATLSSSTLTGTLILSLHRIIPRIPLWACVLLTSLDVFLILLMFSQYPTKFITRSMRLFELFIGVLVLMVVGSFIALLVKVGPDWGDAFHGYVPGPKLIQGQGLYIAVGILGATAMPHAFFLGSKMSTMRRLDLDECERLADGGEEGPTSSRPSPSRLGPRLHLPQPVSLGSFDITAPRRPATQEDGPPVRPTLAVVNAHLSHAVWDIVGSLLGFAIVVNSAILILASAVFFYGPYKSTNPDGVSDLFDAFHIIKEYIGSASAYIFAVALFAAGQSASLTVTLSGQILSEGFIEWHTKPWKRRLITRTIGIIPSLAVSVAVGRSGLDTLLVASQVALSIVLPFVIAPLVYFTSSHAVMALPTSPLANPLPTSTTLAPNAANVGSSDPRGLSRESESSVTARRVVAALNPFRRRRAPPGFVSFANGVLIIYLCCILWLLIATANVYALVTL